jgi:NADH dehydrogenase FAD-containing subunit
MKVLVIGGGFGGLTTCTSLRKSDKSVEIILVEPKEYFEIAWASYRSVFDHDIAEKALFDLEKWAVPKSVRLIPATVTQLTLDSATLSTGEVIEFNVCVIATGAATAWPALGRGPPMPGQNGSREQRLAALKAEGKKLIAAGSVLVVGGGLIGIETAGDLLAYAKMAGKPLQVTLVHSKEKLSEEFTPNASKMTQKKLETLGVKVILNEKVVDRNGKYFLEKSGQEMAASQVIWTTGLKPLNSFLDAKFLDKKGWLQVDDYFRVKGAKNKLFAIGDCCDLLPNAGNQVLANLGTIGKNIKLVLDAQEKNDTAKMEKKMRKALASQEVYVATVGPSTGVALTPMCHTQFMLPWFKNWTMFLFAPKGDLGLKD